MYSMAMMLAKQENKQKGLPLEGFFKSKNIFLTSKKHGCPGDYLVECDVGVEWYV